MKIQKIETIKKHFNREWLLIAVSKVDETTTTPVSGRLIAHSPHRDEVYRKLLSLKRIRGLLVEYSEDRLPKGYAAAFNIMPQPFNDILKDGVLSFYESYLGVRPTHLTF